MKKNKKTIAMILIIIISLNIAQTIKADQNKNTNNILFVGGNGPGNYSKIQNAVDNANNGDTVFVFNDTSPYNENIIINKSIKLIGEDKNTTIIDGNNKDKLVIIVESDKVEINNFTIQNSGKGYNSGAMQIKSNYTTIRNNIVINHKFVGILIYRSNNNIITGNTITKIQDTGLFLLHSDNNLINNNQIIKNGRYAMSIDSYSNNNQIVFNEINYNYGGIHLIGDTAFAKPNNISRNNIKRNIIGIYSETSINNITKNNFILNLIHATFCCENPEETFWDQNYWGRPRFLAKPLLGRELEEQGPIAKEYLRIEYDKKPAKKPYNNKKTILEKLDNNGDECIIIGRIKDVKDNGKFSPITEFNIIRVIIINYDTRNIQILDNVKAISYNDVFKGVLGPKIICGVGYIKIF